MATKKPAPKPAAKKPPAKKAAPKKKAAPRTRVTVPAVVEEPKRTGAGRPTLYRDEYCQQATNYCLLGATDAELAKFFGVTETTINKWKLDHPEFSESICEGREKADAHIAAALYHRAKGYSHPEDDIRSVSLGANAGSEIVITPTTRHYPPDTQAASLWLRNRQPHRWRDKVDVEHSGGLRLEQLPDHELKDRLAEAIAKINKLKGG